jgi:hypothetical protein
VHELSGEVVSPWFPCSFLVLDPVPPHRPTDKEQKGERERRSTPMAVVGLALSPSAATPSSSASTANRIEELSNVARAAITPALVLVPVATAANRLGRWDRALPWASPDNSRTTPQTQRCRKNAGGGVGISPLQTTI